MLKKREKTEITELIEKINDREKLISTFENNLVDIKKSWNDDYNNFMKQHNNFNLSFDEKLLNEFKEETKILKSKLCSKISEKYVGKGFYEIFESASDYSIAIHNFNGFQLGGYGEYYLKDNVIRYVKDRKDGMSICINYDEHMDITSIECFHENYKPITVDINKTINDMVYKIDGIGTDMSCFINGLMGKSEEGAVYALPKEECVDFD